MKNNKIPSAKDFGIDFNHTKEKWDDKFEDVMIAFAKLHVTAALQAAAENAEIIVEEEDGCDDHTPYWGACVSCSSVEMPKIRYKSISKDSILNAYSKELIK